MTTAMSGQNYVDYKVPFTSKYQTAATIEILIKFSDSSETPPRPYLAKELDSITQKILHNFSTSEIYYFDKHKIDSLLNESFKFKLNDSKYRIEKAFITYADISKETKELVDYLISLDMAYLNVELKIYSRQKEIINRLKSKKLDSNERDKLKEELFVLERSKYVRDIYNKNLNILEIGKN